MGMGAGCELTVTTVGWQEVCAVFVTVLRTRLILRAGSPRAISRALTFLTGFLTIETWADGVSATCTAPPPMIAPPQVHAHNFARAIRTDMINHSLQTWES